MLGTVIIVLLLLAVIGGLPTWGYAAHWGYGPSGAVGAILILVVILMALGFL